MIQFGAFIANEIQTEYFSLAHNVYYTNSLGRPMQMKKIPSLIRQAELGQAEHNTQQLRTNVFIRFCHA